jgi:Ca2+-binding EF-hand superfamily protein
MMSKRRALEHLRRVTHFLTDEQIVELQVHAPQFSETLLRKLFIRFMNLDHDRSGTLTCQEFCMMPELQVNPLSFRLFDAFDVNEDGHLDFAEFIGCVHVMSPLCTANDKASAMFRIYDVDSDGIISRDDLKYILGCVTHRPKSKSELTIGINVKETLDEHLQREREWDRFIGSIVNEIMKISASDPDDNFLTFEDFMQSLATTQADFREKMNIPFSL